MTDIHVIFPPTGGVVVTHERQPVIEKGTIFWHVQSGNTNVKSVKIEFDDSDAKSFPVQTGRQNHLEKTLEYLKGKDALDTQLPGSTSMWGEAPVYGKGRRDDKYTITGFDGSGKEIAVLDPVIITDRPRP
jgi:hypothetical protein